MQQRLFHTEHRRGREEKGNALTQLEFALAGKVALVTGGGRGLGLAIATALASAGAFVLIKGRDQERLTRKDIRATYGRLAILINNAGVRDHRWPPGAQGQRRRAHEPRCFHAAVRLVDSSDPQMRCAR